MEVIPCADRFGTFAHAVQAKWERIESENLCNRFDDGCVFLSSSARPPHPASQVIPCADRFGTFAHAVQAKWERTKSENLKSF